MDQKITFCATLGVLAATALHAETKKPNVVVFIADDLFYQDVRCFGGPDAITPNIDRLASEGMRFDNFHQATAMSSPTRQCLLSGLYPARSGAYPNHTKVYDWVKTLPAYFNDMGYMTANQGKTHYAPAANFPFQKTLQHKDSYFLPKPAEEFMLEAKAADRPFLLYFGSNNSHSPWTVGDPSQYKASELTIPPHLIDTENTRRDYVKYLAEVTELDDEVGRMDSILTLNGLRDNTIFLFLTEHGHTFPFAKWTCYRMGLQAGVIMRYPAVVEAGSTTMAMCEYVDVVPTLIDMVGGEIPEGLDGASFKDVALGKTQEFKQYTFGMQTTRGVDGGSECYPVRSVFDGKYRYIVNLTPENTFKCNYTGVGPKSVYGSWYVAGQNDSAIMARALQYVTRPAEEFYVFENDPYELSNQIDNPVYKVEIERLRSVLKEFMKEHGDEGIPTEMKAHDRQTGGVVAQRQAIIGVKKIK